MYETSNQNNYHQQKSESQLYWQEVIYDQVLEEMCQDNDTQGVLQPHYQESTLLPHLDGKRKKEIIEELHV